MTSTEHFLDHPLLGKIRGQQHDVTVQFLGMKYASLAGRFSPPVLYNGNKGEVLDATKIGYLMS